MRTIGNTLALLGETGSATRELGALYGGSPLPDLPVQYSDFAAWQRRLLGGKTREVQLRYWREALADLPAALDLPMDRPRPVQPTHGGAGWVTTIGRDTTARQIATAKAAPAASATRWRMVARWPSPPRRA